MVTDNHVVGVVIITLLVSYILSYVLVTLHSKIKMHCVKVGTPDRTELMCPVLLCKCGNSWDVGDPDARDVECTCGNIYTVIVTKPEDYT